MYMRTSLWIAVALLALGAFAACGGGGGDDATPTRPAATSGPAGTAEAGATPSGEIRERNLANAPAVRSLLAETGGVYAPADVLYADLTEDGVDDAVVPIASGGTLGNVAFVVLTPTQDGTSVVLEGEPSSKGGMAFDIVDGKLLVVEAVFGTDDPECCPSLLRKTTYAWNGAALALEDEETVENPGGVVKPTASP